MADNLELDGRGDSSRCVGSNASAAASSRYVRIDNALVNAQTAIRVTSGWGDAVVHDRVSFRDGNCMVHIGGTFAGGSKWTGNRGGTFKSHHMSHIFFVSFRLTFLCAIRRREVPCHYGEVGTVERPCVGTTIRPTF